MPFPAEAMKTAARRGLFNACLDWATQVVRALLDWAAARRLAPSLAGKLVKGVCVWGGVNGPAFPSSPALFPHPLDIAISNLQRVSHQGNLGSFPAKLKGRLTHAQRSLKTELLTFTATWPRLAFLLLTPAPLPVADLKASVARKAEYSFPYRGLRVVKTSLLSEATLYLADYTVAVSVECFAAVMWQKGPGPARARRLARRAALHGVRCGMVLATVSVGEPVHSCGIRTLVGQSLAGWWAASVLQDGAGHSVCGRVAEWGWRWCRGTAASAALASG